MKIGDIEFVFAVIKTNNAYRLQDVKEHLHNDGASRVPIYYNQYEAEKLCRRTPNSKVVKIKYDTFNWEVANHTSVFQNNTNK